jgi:gliding motility-associated-like protein
LNRRKHQILTLFFLLSAFSSAFAQCPPNIDFEEGDFTGWTLYTGNVTETGGISLIPGPADGNRHQIVSSSNAGPGSLDYFGGFPVYCPNGSRHSLKLGNAFGGAQAEGASYEFTIPADAHNFNITYYYAVVFQDPGHAANQQPRLNIDVENLTDHTKIDCSSFSFIAIGGLPGFIQSPKFSPGDATHTTVWYKDWSANSINLEGYEGKTIRLFFKTADCTFSVHFGYAYIDVETQCSSSFAGASFCPADAAIDVQGPYGYESYTWYSSDYSEVLGTSQTLHLSPPPPAGTTVNVQVTPFAGYGCTDTLTANLTADLLITAHAGADIHSCDNAPVQIGSPPVPGVVYKWRPEEGLSNPNISNPSAAPGSTTEYILTASSPGGGCTAEDTVKVFKLLSPNTITLTGSASYCENSTLLSILHVNAADSIQWYQDGAAIPGEHGTDFTVTETGTYHATLFSTLGCQVSTPSKTITVFPSPTALFSIANNIICMPRDTFHFTNLSSIISGDLQYHWTFGNGDGSDLKSPAYSYNFPGSYQVALHVSAAGDCAADFSLPVTVKPGADPDFAAENICVNLPLTFSNLTAAPGAATVNYLWDFGDNTISTDRNPQHTYLADGSYTVQLSASTPECPNALVKSAPVIVTKPADGVRYPDHPAIISFSEPLEARSIGVSALWTPAANLSNPTVFNPYFKGAADQLYTIKITTKERCVTVDTVLVKPYKKIGINVPTGFTPNGDGINDYLKPILWGIKRVNYFRVFNRYGNLLFEMKSDEPGWDGKLRGTLQNIQTVVWLIEAVDVDGKLHREQGTSILMR